MYIYNVTVNVEVSVVQEWKNWMKTTHIPEVMKTGYFEHFKMLRLVNESEDAEGETFAIQYSAQSLSSINSYLSIEAPLLQKEHMERYGSRCVAFRTVLEEV
jgi:hypothetical protein